ncbi:MAG: hypothetical protein ABI628_01865 [Chloroflexota bacterium]
MRADVHQRVVRLRAGRMIWPLGWAGVAALLALSVLGPASVGAASPPVPSSGSVTVDGSTGDWNLSADHFADMTDTGIANGTVRARLYLRYDCASETLFALVLGVDGIQFRETRPENAYVRIDGAGKLVSGESGNDGTPPDFSWVHPDGTLADGWEASGSLAPGDYRLRVHVLRPDDSSDGYAQVDNIGRDDPLKLVCASATPTPAPTGTIAPTATPTGTIAPTATPRKTPSGGVSGVTAKPRVTLPPTATLASTEPAVSSLGVVFLGLGLVLAGALVLLEKPKLAGGRRR